MTRAAPEVRLWTRVVIGDPDECWPWTGGRSGRRGYGAIMFQGRMTKTHRLAWILTNGPIPAGLQVLHSCDNPPCCNPAHLFLGTNLDNVADKIAKGRDHNQRKTHCKRGHEFTPENTLPNGRNGKGRRCRRCAYDNTNERNRRQREKGSA